MRLKGSTSFEDLDGKAAFKLKFPKDSRPSAFGLKKMTLNNMVQDPSMVHETLDDQALERIFATGFDDPQHLYEGENGADVVPGGAADFAIDEGEDAPTSKR